MRLYLYDIQTKQPVLTIDMVQSYTAEQVITEDGAVLSPLAECCELSAKADCSEMLRADWREKNPNVREWMNEVDAALAQLLFGGEAE